MRFLIMTFFDSFSSFKFRVSYPINLIFLSSFPISGSFTCDSFETSCGLRFKSPFLSTLTFNSSMLLVLFYLLTFGYELGLESLRLGTVILFSWTTSVPFLSFCFEAVVLRRASLFAFERMSVEWAVLLSWRRELALEDFLSTFWLLWFLKVDADLLNLPFDLLRKLFLLLILRK